MCCWGEGEVLGICIGMEVVKVSSRVARSGKPRRMGAVEAGRGTRVEKGAARGKGLAAWEGAKRGCVLKGAARRVRFNTSPSAGLTSAAGPSTHGVERSGDEARNAWSSTTARS